ncbi:hypothetical protein HBA55_25375 [Pseudomaricurvus alkylphenolicus]|uniref:RIO1 family regulatory kinase/ATPase domain-containing protein n=1 Tax=Pseudomaricurvus alkylphenolicus TaxID=1306991 RepID=UPI00141E2858|nr:hypothetical protein [Pseudomaricurvus alkylphenolicus]
MYRLAAASVRVPKPFGCFGGVLLMELVTDDDGDAAPRLGEVSMSAEQAREDHALIMHYVMLKASSLQLNRLAGCSPCCLSGYGIASELAPGDTRGIHRTCAKWRS